MKTEQPEFAPLELERAEELRDVINRAAREEQALVMEPEEEGVTGTASPDLLSPTEGTNALVRYQRHYAPGTTPARRSCGPANEQA